jgi:hypothetical protein
MADRKMGDDSWRPPSLGWREKRFEYRLLMRYARPPGFDRESWLLVQPNPQFLNNGRKVGIQAAIIPNAGSMTDQIPISLARKV